MHNFDPFTILRLPQGLITTWDFIRMLGFMHTRRTDIGLDGPSRFHMTDFHCGKLLKTRWLKSQNGVDAIEDRAAQWRIQIRVPESNMTMLCQTMNLSIFG